MNIKIFVKLWHKWQGCPLPPPILEKVIASLGGVSVWEQRSCTCGKRTHWRRDYPSEPFYLWKTISSGMRMWEPDESVPISADLRE